MTYKFKKYKGFTLIEITLVIIVMGILAAAIAPMLSGVVGRAQADAERSKLKVLKEALLADALEKGGFVDPLTITGGTAPLNTGGTPQVLTFSPVVTFSQYLPASASALALGLPLTSAFNNTGGDNLALNAVPAYLDLRPASFLYDVKETLTRTASTSSPLTFCTNAVTALAAIPAATLPQVCQRAAGHEALVACQVGGAVASPDLLVPAAMVLVSRGRNRQFEFENLEGYNASGTAAQPNTTPPEISRTYESSSRGVNYSNDTGAYYDDAVESISIAEVVSACQKRGILTDSACPSGQRQVRLINNSAVSIYPKDHDVTGVAVLAGSELPFICAAGTQRFSVLAASDGATPITGTTNVSTRFQLDTNGDGTAVIVCSASSCTYN